MGLLAGSGLTAEFVQADDASAKLSPQVVAAADKAETAELEATIAECDALLVPSTPFPAPPIGQNAVLIDGVEEEVRIATTRLQRGVNSLGLPAQRQVNIVPPPDLEAQNVSERAVDDLIQAAMRMRPDLAAAQAQVRAAQSNVTVQESLGKPSISAFGSLGGTNSVPGPDPRSGAIGVQLNIPLFTGFRNTYRVYQAREQVEFEAANRDRLASDISLDVWRAYQDLRTQRQALDAANDLVASAVENYNVALARYKAGVGTITDLLTAQSAQIDAELQRIRARYQWNLAKATLAKAIGVLQPDLITQHTPPSYNR